MAVTTELTGLERARAGERPTRFIISPLGEVFHHWPDGTETGVGSVNLTDLAASYGIDDHMHMCEQYVEREFDRLLHREFVDPRERVLHALWASLQPLEGDFRFYANIIDDVMRLWMTVEYILDAHQYAALQAEVLTFQGAAHVEIDPMWVDHDEPEKVQYEVRFDVLGKNFTEVAMLQLRWLSSQSVLFPESKVNVV